MRQIPWIALVSVLTLFLGGCPGGDGGEETGGEASPSPSPVASPVAPRPRSAPAATQSFPNPTTPKQAGNPVAVPGLLQTLPPDARVNQIPKGRNDPFAVIPVQPQVADSPGAAGGGGGKTVAARPVPVLPQLPSLKTGTGAGAGAGGNRLRTPGRAGQGQAARPGGTGRTQPSSPARPTTPKPGLIPPPPPLFSPSLPPIPEPTLARGIEVTGVIDVGGVPRAIVKVPNEPSRYVQAGQRLLNGQVLVKRIEVNRGPEPVVILEQFGVEVARRIGEKPTGTAGQPGGPTAFVPPPPTTPIPSPLA